MALVVAKEATALSLTRAQHVANNFYEILKAGQQWAKGEINKSNALSIMADRGIKVGGAIVGTAAGATIGTMIVATNWWNPLGWVAMFATTYIGCTMGQKAGELLSSGFDITGVKESFRVLGIPYTENYQIVRERYLELSKIRHPDRGGSTKEFQELNEAYLHLTAHFSFSEKSTFQKVFSNMTAGIAWLSCAGATAVNAGIAVLSTTKKIAWDE